MTTFIPNPAQVLETQDDGIPFLKIVLAGMGARQEYFLGQGQSKQFQNVVFNFSDQQVPNAIQIKYEDNGLYVRTNRPLTQMTMATQRLDTIEPTGEFTPLIMRSLYSDGQNSFVISEFNPSGLLRIKSEDLKVRSESNTALVMQLSVNGETRTGYVFGQKGVVGRPTTLQFRDMDIDVSYGSKPMQLPFSVKLYDFIMDVIRAPIAPCHMPVKYDLLILRRTMRKIFVFI